jgi:DNA primase
LREGRQLRFLFLPEGHDPDTLVGEEGREAFERRLEQSLPLSEYLVQELGSQVDLGNADGKARFAELARPLIARVPEGVYRELLIERLAEAIRLPADRLRALWQGEAARSTAKNMARSSADLPSNMTGRSAGRGGLMRQSVLMLVHHPAIAAELSPKDLATLATIEEPGADILRRLIEDLRLDPCKSTAQLLERWRDQPEQARLARLAATEALITAAEGARRELQNAISRMGEEARRRRLDTLLAKEQESGLSAEEKRDLQALMSGKI